jgi:hypothetical protein
MIETAGVNGSDDPPLYAMQRCPARSKVTVPAVPSAARRTVATHLGVGPMSLYRSVADKDDLLRQMADHASARSLCPPRVPRDGGRSSS